MSDSEIKDAILKILKNVAPDTDPAALLPDDDIRATLGIDSFDALQVVVAVEKQLGVDIPEQDYGKTTTLKDMVAYIETHQ